eukprot:566078-Prorocentrum_minimum.AAC.3
MAVDEGYDHSARPHTRQILGVIYPGESVSVPVTVLRPDPHTCWELSLRPHQVSVSVTLSSRSALLSSPQPASVTLSSHSALLGRASVILSSHVALLSRASVTLSSHLRPQVPPGRDGPSEVFSWGHESPVGVGPRGGGEGGADLTCAVDDRSASALFEPSGVGLEKLSAKTVAMVCHCGGSSRPPGTASSVPSPFWVAIAAEAETVAGEGDR